MSAQPGTLRPAELPPEGPALVTGGSGFFGTILIEQLLLRGWRVRNFDIHAMDEAPAGPVEFVQGDIRDRAAVRRACEGAAIVFHCVAQVPLARDKELFQSVNVEGTRILLEAAHEAGVGNVVMVASKSIYGIPNKLPVDEAESYKPLEDYGKAKLAALELAREFSGKSGLNVATIVPTTIGGRGRLGLFQVLFEWIAEGRAVYVFGRGDNDHQMVHGEDVAQACILASRIAGFQVYNAGSRDCCTMRQMLEAIAAHAGTGSRVRSTPKLLTTWAVAALSKLKLLPFAPFFWIMYGQSFRFDDGKIRRELGYEPRWGNIEMMIESYDWYLRHRDEVKARKNTSIHRSPLKQGMLKVLRWFS